MDPTPVDWTAWSANPHEGEELTIRHKLTIAVVGAGNAAHVLVGLLGGRPDVRLKVLACYDDEASKWNTILQKEHFVKVKIDRRVLRGSPEMITASAEKAIQDADMIILALPAFAHGLALKEICQFMKPKTILVVMCAMAAFDLEFKHVLGRKSNDCVCVGLETLPWAARISSWGSEVRILGVKDRVDCAVRAGGSIPSARALALVRQLLAVVGGQTKFVEGGFLGFSLSNLFHATLMYGQYHLWDGKPMKQAPLFYHGIDLFTADLLSTASDELLVVKTYLLKKHPTLDLRNVVHAKDWLKYTYPTTIQDDSSLLSCFLTNQAYSGLRHPVVSVPGGFMPNFKSRYLTEDVPYGLLVARGVAELAGVDTPTITMILLWCQQVMGKEYIVPADINLGKIAGAHVSETRTPQRFGYSNLDTFIRDTHHETPRSLL